jgi:ubiquinol-cytochrome c reductase iron-sulfur subunit
MVRPGPAIDGSAGPLAPRRDFLKLITGASALVGVGAMAWPFIDSMNPDAGTIAGATPAVVALLSDPDSKVYQQPPYAENWHRSIQPEYGVFVAVCTHLGCLPECLPSANPTSPARNWPGGYFCHCHGSKYDLAGQVFTGVPAPYNLPVPPYHFPTRETVRIGANPPGTDFSLGSVVRL